MVIFGYINRLKSRPAFMIGTIVNQISEFSLILATLCRQAGIFSDRIFLLITLSTVTTIFLSSMGHQFLEKLYSLFRVPLSILDRHSLAKRQEELGGFKLEDHVVVIEYNELAEKVLDFFLDAGRRVLLIDIDPEVYDEMHGKHENLRCMYGDVFDPDVREDAAFHKAHAIISCLVDGQPAEIGILDWLQENGHDVPFLAATDSRKDALELYMHNATYVMQTEELAATRFHEILLEYGSSLRNLGALSDAHIESLKEASRKKTFQFT